MTASATVSASRSKRSSGRLIFSAGRALPFPRREPTPAGWPNEANRCKSPRFFFPHSTHSPPGRAAPPQEHLRRSQATGEEMADRAGVASARAWIWGGALIRSDPDWWQGGPWDSPILLPNRSLPRLSVCNPSQIVRRSLCGTRSLCRAACREISGTLSFRP